MTDLQNVSVKTKNYKCFGEEPQGFEYIKPINVLIGRNNCGKSSLLDVLNHLFSSSSGILSRCEHKGKKPAFICSFPMDESTLRNVFNPGTSGGEIGGNHWDFGRRWIGKKIEVLIPEGKSMEFVSTDPPLENERLKGYFQHVAERIPKPYELKIFKILRSERDITPEPPSKEISIKSKGGGATNLIRKYITQVSHPSELVEKKLLQELNKIMEPDSSFERILVQEIENNQWEIFFEEKTKGTIPLSLSGSGLKTVEDFEKPSKTSNKYPKIYKGWKRNGSKSKSSVLLVLIFILLVPDFENKPLEKYIFAFEELENNLHPALQRRLFGYLRNLAVNNNSIIFITTHSNVVIDFFSKDENAQIYHIPHDGIEAHVRPVKTYIEKSGILDDLDVRASDLLQSNGVIWVEGPSDRIYINRWIELWSEDKFRDGEHYQCIFYGGRLLSHLTAEPIVEDEREELINILLTNRNAIIIMDSDKKSEEDDINETKKRIEKEINDVGGYCWITEGKEIENYIPKSALSSFYDNEISDDIDKYVPLWDYLDTIKEGEGKKYSSKKVLFAEKIRPFFTKEDLSRHLDLNTQLELVVSKIKQWNPEPALQNDNKKPKQLGEEEI